jgi:Uma2 family endonuclease
MAAADSSMPIVTGVAPLPLPDGVTRVRFSRDAFYRMFENGVLPNDRRYELIDGEIVMMSPIGPSNSSFISRLTEFFVKNLPEQFECRVQLPIVVSDYSEPEPDLGIVRRQDASYHDKHPKPADVVLLVEVASTSLKFDLGAKQRLYAEALIPEFWVLDVDGGKVIVHRQPSAGAYQEVQQLDSKSKIAPLAIPNCELELKWLFR